MLLLLLSILLAIHLSSSTIIFPIITGYFIKDLYNYGPDIAKELTKKWVINGVADETQIKTSLCGYNVLGGVNISPSGSSLSRTYTDLPTHGIGFYILWITAIDDWQSGQKIYLKFDNRVVFSYEPSLYVPTEGSARCGSSTQDTFIKIYGTVYHTSSDLTFTITSGSGSSQAYFSISDFKVLLRDQGSFIESACARTFVVSPSSISGTCPCSEDQYYDTASSSCGNCHQSCDGCFGPSSTQCHMCGAFYSYDASTGECIKCTGVEDCLLCTGTAANQCKICRQNKLTPAGTCESTCASQYIYEKKDLEFCNCPPGKYPDNNGNCVSCPSECAECTSPTICTSCDPATSLVNGKCQCPSGKFFISGSGCSGTCSQGCNHCTSNTVCTECYSGPSLVSGQCQCPTGKYYMTGSGCVGTCSFGCNECPSDSICTACDSGTSIVNGECQCPSGKYYIPGSGCSGTCSVGCNKCTSDTVCTECYSGPSLVSGECQCPSGTFFTQGSGCSGTCSRGCNRCSDETLCTECYSGPSLVSGQCECPTGKYYVLGSGCTGTCSLGCNKCSSDSVCTTCHPSASLVSGACQCPSGKFFVEGSGCTGTCSQGCNRCTSESVCTECLSGPSLVSGQCQCPSGTFFILGSGCTGTCSQGCNRCSSETVCTECYSGPSLVSGQCQCPVGKYYILGSGCTGTCSLGCNVCSSDTFCTECRSPYSLQVISTTQICKTPCQDIDQYMKAGGVCTSSCDFPMTARTETVSGVQAKFCENGCNPGPNTVLYWDGSCQASCSGYPRIENGEMFCDACPPGLFSYSSRICWPTCPPPYTQRFLGGSQFCDRPCPAGQYYNSDNMQCVAGCEYPYEIIAGDFCAINLSEEQVKTIGSIAEAAGVTDFAGTTIGRSVGFAQFTNPVPVFIQLFTDMLSYLRYINIKFPSNLHYYFSRQATSDMPSIPDMPEKMKSNLPKNPLPNKKFEENKKLHSSFLVNFWKSFLFLLVIPTGVGVVMLIERFKNKHQVITILYDNLDERLRWNFTITLFTPYIPTIVLFSSMEFSTFNPDSVSPVLSFVICIGFNILILFMFVKLFRVIKANWDLTKQKRVKVVPENEKSAAEEKVDSSLSRYVAVFKKCKTDSFLQQSFMLIVVGRVYLYCIIIGYLYNFPLVQPILIIILSVLMLAYATILRPMDRKIDVALLIGQETLMLAVNICVLILSRYDAVDEDTNKIRTSIGYVAIALSMTLSSLGLVYLGANTLLILKENYPMIKGKVKEFMAQRKNPKQKKLSLETRSSILLTQTEPDTPKQVDTETLKIPVQDNLLLSPSSSPLRKLVRESFRISGQPLKPLNLGDLSERCTLTLEPTPRPSTVERELDARERNSRIHPLGQDTSESPAKRASLFKYRQDLNTPRKSQDMSPMFQTFFGDKQQEPRPSRFRDVFGSKNSEES